MIRSLSVSLLLISIALSAQPTPAGAPRAHLAAISGTVHDPGPVPSVHGFVEAFGQSAGSRGGMVWRPVARADIDSTGRYRLFDLCPGRYLVRATPGRSPYPPGPALDTDPNFVPAPTFYPSTLVDTAATALDVPSGADRTGIDITIQRTRPMPLTIRPELPPGAPERRPALARDFGVEIVSGVVREAETGAPIAGARVLVFPLRDPGPAKAALTNAAGQFSISGLPGGPLYAEATHPNYPGALALGQPGAFAVLGPGDAPADLTLPLQPGGAVSGRVTDHAEAPLAGCRALLVPAPIDDAPTSAVASTTTDDRGLFRLAPIPPDRYTLAVRCPSTGHAVYYPNSLDPNGAEQFAVRYGAELRRDFHLPPPYAVTLTGTVAGAPDRQLVYVHADRPGLPELRWSVTRLQDGTFRFDHLASGAYTLFTASESDGRVQAYSLRQILIGTAAPTAVALRLRPAVTLTGRVDSPHGGTVILQPIDHRGHDPIRARLDPADGNFRLAGVTPGRWRVRFEPGTEPAWLDSVKYGNAVAVNREIQIGEGPPSTLVLGLRADFIKPKLEAHAPTANDPTYWMIYAASDELHSVNRYSETVPPGQYTLLAVPLAENGGRLNARLAALIRRTQPLTELTAGGATFAVPCWTQEKIDHLIARYLKGEIP